jgi:hypothetical protein
VCRTAAPVRTAPVRTQVTDGRWFRFDDRTVEPWDVSRLEAECFGGKPPAPAGAQPGARPPPDRPYSAYMLFYDRRR